MIKAETATGFSGGLRPNRSRGRALAAAAFLLGAVTLTATVAGAAGKPGKGNGDPEPPNIVVVMTDDQEMMTEDGARVWLRRQIMPSTFDLFTNGGTVFQNYFVTTPVCCPSRASYFTGQYGHNNGVLANKPGYAGLVAPENLLPVWMQEAGYVTAHVGRWLHGYADVSADPGAPAPGWDRWVALLNFDRYYGYDLSVDGTTFRYGTKTHDYATEVLNKRALGFVRQNIDGPKPIFLNIAHVAPHSAKALPNQCSRSAIPARQDYDLFQNELLPVPPSYNEEDLSDKPLYLQTRAPIEALESGELRRRYRCRLASLRSVDRGVNQLVKAFNRAGELDDTVFIFTSDNGYFSGEHRLRSGKGLPYEEAIKVPMAIRIPRKYLDSVPVPESTLPTANIDLAPTLLELAGGQPCDALGNCRALDGRSVVRLVEGSGKWPEDRAIVIEQKNEIEGLARRRDFGPCTYVGIRTSTQLYTATTSTIDSTTGQCVQESPPLIEHYDLTTDPFELQNLFVESNGPTEVQVALGERLMGLRDCAGTFAAPVPGRTACE